jgi:uncharacterized protein (TIGR03067 family)
MQDSLPRSFAAGLLAVCGLLGCQPAKDSKEPEKAPAKAMDEDLKKMQGTWTLVSGEADGMPLPEEVVKVAELTISGDAYTVELGEQGTKKGTQTLDSTKLPKHINARDASGPTVGENHGIYEFLANDDLRVCFGAPGKERPSEFATKPGSGTFIHVWRRAKPQ